MSKTKYIPDERTGPTRESVLMLQALSRRYRQGMLHIYEGTVSDAEREKRRAKNRVARKQRRVNRRRGA